ncbi:MAG: translation elongation factor-like protein [Candidatus Altiarchaeota archaeon]|nr:translation elongation factor-like protein [Candidatus Altiarchaeota archaeon]
MKKVGSVSHYFTKLGVCVIELEADIKEGDKLTIKGSTTDFEQVIGSMEIDRKKVTKAKSGQSVGTKVRERVREGDEVFKA